MFLYVLGLSIEMGGGRNLLLMLGVLALFSWQVYSKCLINAWQVLMVVTNYVNYVNYVHSGDAWDHVASLA